MKINRILYPDKEAHAAFIRYLQSVDVDDETLKENVLDLFLNWPQEYSDILNDVMDDGLSIPMIKITTYNGNRKIQISDCDAIDSGELYIKRGDLFCTKNVNIHNFDFKYAIKHLNEHDFMILPGELAPAKGIEHIDLEDYMTLIKGLR